MVDGAELTDQNKRNAVRVMLEQLAAQGAALSEFVNVLPNSKLRVPAAGTHLRRVRVVACQRPDQEADNDGLAGRERACGQNPIALAVGRAEQLDALLLGNLGAARLALRGDRRSAATRRGGAGRPGRMNVGQENPFRLTP